MITNPSISHEKVVTNGIYLHFKGRIYLVLGIAKEHDSETRFVVYKELYGNENLSLRKIDDFTELVEVNNQKVPRFKFIEILK